MPENITDVSTFTDPVTTPAGGDARNAASVKDPVQKLSNRTRWLKNLVESIWDGSDFVYPTVTPVPIEVPLFAGAQKEITIVGTDIDWAPSANGGIWTLGNFASSQIRIPLPMLKHGMVIQAVDVIWIPGASRTGSSRMHLQYFSIQPDYATPAAGTAAADEVFDDGSTTSIHTSTITPTSVRGTIDRSYRYWLTLTGGDTTDIDKVEGIRIRVQSDPGPRNG